MHCLFATCKSVAYTGHIPTSGSAPKQRQSSQKHWASTCSAADSNDISFKAMWPSSYQSTGVQSKTGRGGPVSQPFIKFPALSNSLDSTQSRRQLARAKRFCMRVAGWASRRRNSPWHSRSTRLPSGNGSQAGQPYRSPCWIMPGYRASLATASHAKLMSLLGLNRAALGAEMLMHTSKFVERSGHFPSYNVLDLIDYAGPDRMLRDAESS
jgi:hypothetical protein